MSSSTALVNATGTSGESDGIDPSSPDIRRMRGGSCHIALLLSTAILVAGCGGSEPVSYTLQGSRACLSQVGPITPKAEMNDLAFDAREAVGVAVGDSNSVELGFEGTANDAKRNAARLKLVGEAIGGPVDDVLMREGNVVILWENTPSDADLASVKDCLG